MRTALISDIHGDFMGLSVALRDIDRNRCQRILCLGDLVEGGHDNVAVLEEIIAKKIPCLRGNHDEFHSLGLEIEGYLDYMKGLPESLIESDVIYTHISPRTRKNYIGSKIEAWNVFEDTAYRLTFVGHVHEAIIFGQKTDELVSANQVDFVYNQAVPLARDDRYIICVGPINAVYSRDCVDKVRYAIFSDTDNSIEMRKVD